MSIRIDADKCERCGACAEICPGGLISADKTGRAVIERPEDCWGCASCLKECRYGAISYFLGADIGGRGATLTVHERKYALEWVFRRPGGFEKTITVDRSESNKY